MVSIGTKIEQLTGMLGSKDLNNWEQGFVQNVSTRYAATRSLTDTQIEIVDRIWEKHFA